jgi:hypothetical protein
MFHICSNCDYIGRDDEVTCPFCKKALVEKTLAGPRPRLVIVTGKMQQLSASVQHLMSVLVLLMGTALLPSCSSNADLAADGGIALGTVANYDMGEYYYPHEAGHRYVYGHTLESYADENSGGKTVTTGPNDTLTTLGYQGIAPNGDSLFGVAITYRVLTTYAGRPDMTLYYLQGRKSRGAFVDNQTDGALAPPHPTKPVPCDTILAGLYGRMRTVADDFSNTGPFTWQTDSIYFTADRDSVVIWYHSGSSNHRIRQVFYDDVRKGMDWQYGLWENSTEFDVSVADLSLSTNAGVFRSTKIEVVTPDLEMPAREWKWFARNVGLARQVDEWYVAPMSDLSQRYRRVLTRELIKVD